VPSFLEALQYDFLRHAVIAGVLAAALCGVVGTFVVVKRLAFVSGGISHAAFGGLGLCYFLGVDPILGAVAVSLLSAVLLGMVDTERLKAQDALIGVLWAVGVAIGVVFLAKTPGYAPNLMTYLFGNILMVTRRDLWMTLALSAVVLLILGLFFKDFVAVAFDETFAAVQGVPVRSLMTLLLMLVALTVVLLIQVVGILLVIALLTIPPLIALLLFKDLRSVLLASTTIGVAITLAGLALSYLYDLPSGPAIVLLGALLLALVYPIQTLRRRAVR
jgi:zinc transport system permease protein